MKLDPAQQDLLSAVSTADIAWRDARRDAFARAKIIVDDEIRSYLAARDHRVRLAFEANIPKAAIGREGLHTSSPSTVNDSLARTGPTFGSPLGPAPRALERGLVQSAN